ncbi:MAG: LL-diaminopimelate aminotransferase [Candidatus Omnitrophica bacterium]|nr:LL-diaminopimelate aminotransferase [Candidatus Omnitrophota bacterium]
MLKIETADRLKKLPPYLFAEIDRIKKAAIQSGRDIIDLGVGDPDTPTPMHIIEQLYKAASDPQNHRYAMDAGLLQLREAITSWYKSRFNVELDVDTEVLPLIGSKEGIAHIPLAFINHGDEVLIPDPCYPPYKSGTIFAGGVPYLMPLLEENDFLPDLDAIDPQVARRAKIMFINYPNNPTSACATEDFYRKVIDFARDNNIIICHDAAYSEVSFDGYKPQSFLEFDGAKEVGVEFHSLSKTYNMTGWRIGFACGNSEVIAALRTVKSNIDSGIFQAVQFAGVIALEGDQSHVDEINSMYQSRRDALVDGLNRIGWKVSKPKATFYAWIPVPPGYTSNELTKLLLEKADIVTTPGVGFGPNGEGYIRMALTVSEERLAEAVGRIERLHK